MTALLEVENVSIQFGGLRAVEKVSFTAESGQVTSIIGPNGAGKTTLFNAITRNVQIREGSIRLNGREISHLTPLEITGCAIRRTFQNGGLFRQLTAIENILIGLHTEINSGFFGTLLGKRKAREQEHAAIARARELLAEFEIDVPENVPVGQLSGGEQRLIEIARAWSTGARLLMLDEPAVGLSPPVRAKVLEAIRSIAVDKGIGVLMIEHTMEMVLKGSDKIIVLNGGKLLASGSPTEIREDRTVAEAYLGYV
ncbi:ABC transporter ATP-binding protein [Castellaniella sp. GW247-6E4]|uniref:ABC transporter ATP-binding protein n=1 Tax=Castellaniella sp. GW247-6E4 TaxID=3140380 RepID=UPI003314BB38